MDHQNLMPIASQPVNRITTGQLPAELAELSEEALVHGNDANAAITASSMCNPYNPQAQGGDRYSYDGDDAE